MSLRRILTAPFFAFLLAIFSGLPAEAEKECRRVKLDSHNRPSWTISGAWVGGDSDELVLVDSLDNRLLRYSATGRYLGTDTKTAEAVRSSSGRFHPTRLLTQGNKSAWLELTGGTIVRVPVASERETNQKLDLLGLETNDGWEIGSVFDWTIAGNHIVAFGNIKKDGSEEWATGFYKASLDGSEKPVVLKVLDRYAPEKAWYRLGNNLMTSIGGTAYVLTIDDDFTVHRADPGALHLRAAFDITGALAEAPTIPDFTLPEEFIQAGKVLEEATTLVSLYGWKEALYTLWRRDEPDTGIQRWFLTEIDPDRRKVLRTMLIPSQANHLMAVPGPRSWVFVEKGSIGGYGIQENSSLLFIDSSAIRSSSGTSLCR